ncbi:MAG: molybdopterin-guanine dinucleotide biosynthesis protein B [Chlamydiota bacterium]|nr:molybdopterin-guanine dinucleotide biosynthesis protein B [Chlamydiota bacterium]
MQKPYIIAFVGSHNSGKTTILSNIIPLLKAKGIRVGVVKTTHHPDIAIDQPGKDSYKLKEAGAEAVVLSSPNKLAFIQYTDDAPWELCLPQMRHLDCILIEGGKTSNYPKIEVFRQSLGLQPLYCGLTSAIAICTDLSLDTKLPQFRLDDFSGISDFLTQELGRC